MNPSRFALFQPSAEGLRITVAALLLGGGTGEVLAQAATTAYAKMAPIAQYLSPSREDEIALARSAAPPAIANDADVLVFGPKGYETAVKGTNGFVCLVVRPWDTNFDSSDFWNPKFRSPECFNKPAARTVLPVYMMRTDWVLSGVPLSQMSERMRTAVASHKVPPPEIGTMIYMMSKRGYLGDTVGGPWRPHVMFVVPRVDDGAEWGADLKGSPIMSDASRPEPVTMFFIPVGHWSDGSPRPEASAQAHQMDHASAQ